MENNTLTAKEWLRKGFAPVKNLIADEDGSIQQKYFEECMEKYANYKNRILEDRIKEFRNKLTEAQFKMFIKDRDNKTWTIEEKSMLSLIFMEHDKHFNIENKQ
tara:strand:- start:2624 stop:2935 length:312 start_codon:yes stop_codon:yes gene_type:complete